MKTLLPILLLGFMACGGNPPPPGPEPCSPVPDADPAFRWESPNDLELTWVDMPVTVGGGDEKCVLQRRLTFPMDERRTVKSVYSFHGFDNGDSVESLSVLYAHDGKPLYKRSEHLEGITPDYDAFDPPQPVGYEVDGLILDIVCRVTGNNGQTGNLSARCHLNVYVEFEDGSEPPGECEDVESKLVVATCDGQDFRAEVKAATDALGDLRGHDPQENLKSLAAKMIEQTPGLCAFGGIEAVFIERGDGLWEENHAVYFGDGGWTGSGFGVFKGCHREQPAGECAEPIPPPAWKIAIRKFGGTPTGPKFDTTGLVQGFEYCTSVGFVGRASCPVRPECPATGPCPFPDRDACELEVFGVPAWSSDGTVEELSPPNPWYKRVRNGTWVQVCTGPGISPEVCSEKLVYGGTE